MADLDQLLPPLYVAATLAENMGLSSTAAAIRAIARTLPEETLEGSDAGRAQDAMGPITTEPLSREARLGAHVPSRPRLLH